MGKVTLLLGLDSRDATYLPGDTVSGRVTFELKKALKIRGVRVFLKGEELVGWGLKPGRALSGAREEDLTCVGKQVNEGEDLVGWGLNPGKPKAGRRTLPVSANR